MSSDSDAFKIMVVPEGYVGRPAGYGMRNTWHDWHRCTEKTAGQVFHTGQSGSIDLEATSAK